MITATWCENRALMVGMPRRSAEWSTESSCTRVARWISSTTAASVTARGGGSSPPAAWWLSSSSVGRNSLPFIRSRCSLTSAMIGKSAAMIRRSSSTTRSSGAATGRWMSRRATGATCWLTSLRLCERFHAPAHVHEPDVRLVDVLIDPLLEPGEHVLEVLLLVARGLLVLDLHAGVARGLVVREDHRPQVHKVRLGHDLVAHRHLRILRLDLLLRLGGRRGGRRRQHGQGRLGARVLAVVLHHPLVDGPRLLPEIAAQQRVRELEVGVHQPSPVGPRKRQLHLLLAG